MTFPSEPKMQMESFNVIHLSFTEIFALFCNKNAYSEDKIWSL